MTALAIQATDPQNALGWSGVIFTHLERCLAKKKHKDSLEVFSLSRKIEVT